MPVATRTEPVHRARDLRQFRYLDNLIVVFVTVLLVSNIVAPKLVAVGPFLFRSGVDSSPPLCSAS
jgi:hypothetical protein